MENPTYSIIIGVYNHEKTIGQLAEALNRQTYTSFEIHICDDGSTDRTREVFEEKLHPLFKKNKDGTPRYFYHRQDHKGMRLAKNVNQGIKEASGDYCVFIMGDSYPEEHYLEVLNKFIKPNRMLCGVRYQVDNGVGVDVDWRLKRKLIPPENVVIPNYPFRSATGNGLVIPTEATRLYGGWDEDLEGYGGDDFEIVARLYYKGYIFYSLVDAKLFHNWHIAQETDPENIPKLQRKLSDYAGAQIL